MSCHPVIKNAAYCLAHVPDLVRYGSKPRRECCKKPTFAARIAPYLRSYEQAVVYPPNQTFLGNISLDDLAAIPRPWFQRRNDPATPLSQKGKFGEIIDQETFYGLLKLSDVLSPPLFQTDQVHLEKLRARLTQHPLFSPEELEKLHHFSSQLSESEDHGPALTLYCGDEVYGFFHGDERSEGRDDENLVPHDLLENLCAKASGALALKWLLQRENISADKIDFLISCGEEACGDRYQRGGGGMAKAIGEICGYNNASGIDIKNFCAAPVSSLIMASALVQAGIYKRIAVVGGGSLAKLGMKIQGFLQHEMVILDDCLASMAFLVTKDDGASPIIRLEPGAVGQVPIGAATSDESVFRHYLLAPLKKLGLNFTDIDRFAPELQNPEIMEFAGSGDVAAKNYRKIAAMAVLAKQLDKEDMKDWIKKIGMPGFAPTQGHIPSAVPFLGHAIEEMRHGQIKRVMFLARASLFLNRCTTLLDGVSFILERNPGAGL